MKNYTLSFIFFTSMLLSESGLASLQKNGLILKNEDRTSIIIQRKTSKQCNDNYVKPSMLFSGSYAHRDVLPNCKKTFVSKIGLLQPIQLTKEVQTVGELEVLAHIQKAHKNPQAHILIDARTEKWYQQMTIPTAINLPFNQIRYDEDLDIDDFDNKKAFLSYQKNYQKMFALLGIKKSKEGLDFSAAKKALFFCNASWCSQSPNAIYSLINIGYPKTKLLWYRGGLQDWLIYDYNVIKR